MSVVLAEVGRHAVMDLRRNQREELPADAPKLIVSLLADAPVILDEDAPRGRYSVYHCAGEARP